MNIPKELLPSVVDELLTGAARLQARQEMLECVVRALIVEAPPAHPLFWKALQTAQSDWESRSVQSNRQSHPHADQWALQLLNVLRDACKPPTTGAP
jgi:hypothetical protein